MVNVLDIKLKSMIIMNFIVESLKKVIRKDMENIKTKMVQSTKDSGRMINGIDMDPFIMMITLSNLNSQASMVIMMDN
jgi:hypothetical protein